jgi:hypothetical protein
MIEDPDPELDPNPDPYIWLMDLDPGGQKYVDPDPEHWKKGIPVLISISIRGTFSTRYPETEILNVQFLWDFGHNFESSQNLGFCLVFLNHREGAVVLSVFPPFSFTVYSNTL